jgi:hypothetical protein
VTAPGPDTNATAGPVSSRLKVMRMGTDATPARVTVTTCTVAVDVVLVPHRIDCSYGADPSRAGSAGSAEKPPPVRAWNLMPAIPEGPEAPLSVAVRVTAPVATLRKRTTALAAAWYEAGPTAVTEGADGTVVSTRIDPEVQDWAFPTRSAAVAVHR